MYVVVISLLALLAGSNDGDVRVWKCGDDFRSLEPCFSILRAIGAGNGIGMACETTFCTLKHTVPYPECMQLHLLPLNFSIFLL